MCCVAGLGLVVQHAVCIHKAGKGAANVVRCEQVQGQMQDCVWWVTGGAPKKCTVTGLFVDGVEGLSVMTTPLPLLPNFLTDSFIAPLQISHGPINDQDWRHRRVRQDQVTCMWLSVMHPIPQTVSAARTREICTVPIAATI